MVRKKKENNTFEKNAFNLNKYFKANGTPLNFEGIKKTKSDYFSLEDTMIMDSFELMKNCNFWFNYLADIENLVQLLMLEAGLELDIFNANKDSNNTTFALEDEYKLRKDKLSDFKLFYKQIINQKKFFNGAFWHCNKICSRGNNNLKYKTE